MSAAPIRLYDTLTRKVVPLETREPDHVRMYVCGLTVYDLAHVGHARMMVVFDVLARFLETTGWRVTFVRNVTDIDDRIIERASAAAITAAELADRMTEAMSEDLAGLGCRPPDVEPRATQHVGDMVELIERLEERGVAYRSAGDVYFDVPAFPPYGRLSQRRLDKLLAGARVEVGEQKRHPADFALWKAAKPGEPVWESPFGPGRPGWHIECSAMSVRYLGQPFDLHGGGEDLIFPHHENEIAQSEAATGIPFATHWMHVSFLRLGTEKMSKSLGNIVSIRDALALYPAEALRLELLETHYRSPLEFSEAGVDDARRALMRMYETLARVRPGVAPAPTPEADECRTRLREALADDLNTPRAIAALHDAVRAINRQVDAGRHDRAAAIVAALRSGGAVLGILQGDPEATLSEWRSARASAAGLTTDDIALLIEKRAESRRRRDFAAADAVRATLAAAGIDLKDQPDGTTTWSVMRGERT